MAIVALSFGPDIFRLIFIKRTSTERRMRRRSSEMSRISCVIHTHLAPNWRNFVCIVPCWKLCNRPIMHAPMNKYNLLRCDNLLVYLTANHTHGIFGISFSVWIRKWPVTSRNYCSVLTAYVMHIVIRQRAGRQQRNLTWHTIAIAQYGHEVNLYISCAGFAPCTV